MTHPSEAGRYYFPDGKPAYEVQGAKGMVKPDIRHAKKLGLVPSVTTIIAEAAKPGLEHWKIQQGILAALTLPKIEGEPLDAFAERAMRDSKEQAKKAAEKGTAIHAAIQDYYETCMLQGEGVDDYVVATVEAVRTKYGSLEWRPEQSFASNGFGGKVDLNAVLGVGHCGYVLDFKSKEFADTEKKLAWDEHCIQLSAYREGLGIPKAKCANVFVSVNNPGLVHIHEWTEDELQRGWSMFQALLSYWQARTAHKP